MQGRILEQIVGSPHCFSKSNPTLFKLIWAKILIAKVLWLCKELHFHLEESLSRNLHSRCSGYAHEVIDITNNVIQGECCALRLSEHARWPGNHFLFQGHRGQRSRRCWWGRSASFWRCTTFHFTSRLQSLNWIPDCSWFSTFCRVKKYNNQAIFFPKCLLLWFSAFQFR